MKVTYFLPVLLMLLVFSCIEEDELTTAPAVVEHTPNFAKALSESPAGDFEVFFAQTHVLRPQDPYFGLTSDRPALIKAHLTSETGEAAPRVLATLSLPGKTTTLELVGPPILPPPTDLSPGKVVHSFDDSYTKIIPKEWIQPGLEVTIEAGDKQVQFLDLLIGAPNRIPLRMFDVHFFNQSSGDLPDGWKEDMEAKLPTAGFDFDRVPNIVFPEVTIPPRENFAKAARVSSPEEYKTLTGKNFDGEQSAAGRWNTALHLAGGLIKERGVFVTNMYNVPTNGQGSLFGSVSNINKPGVFYHEFGHALDLYHWSKKRWMSTYPYYGAMNGIAGPTKGGGAHAGPTWKFDLEKAEFISPTISSGSGLRYKKDPMAGGGQVDRTPGHIFTHFSDYSVDRMRRFMENRVAVWNEDLGIYARWDSQAGAYTKTIKHNNGVAFPQEADVDVISVMASVSMVTPQANLVYPPIGPYKSGIIQLFDAENAADRSRADQVYCQKGKCDVSVRVEQGGSTTTYILPMSVSTTAGEKKNQGFGTRAINLRASEGEVTKVELLYTPRVEEQGLPTDPRILSTWEKD